MWSFILGGNNTSDKSAVVKNHAALFKRSEVSNLLLANAVLIISDEVKLTTRIFVNSNSANKRLARAVDTNNEIVVSGEQLSARRSVTRGLSSVEHVSELLASSKLKNLHNGNAVELRETSVAVNTHAKLIRSGNTISSSSTSRARRSVDWVISHSTKLLDDFRRNNQVSDSFSSSTSR